MKWFRRKSRGAAPQAGQRSYRPEIEALEARRVPTNGSAFAANLIVHSTENFADFVTNEYIILLRRLPDIQGLNSWVQALTNGMRPEAVEAAFVASPEYILDHGNTSSGFLVGLYNDLLGRAPDMAGFNNWMNMLARGLSPTQVAMFFATSAEREAIVVTRDYLTLLGRTPEAGAVAFWVSRLNSGLNRADVESQIVGSNEFFQRQGGTDVDFVVGTYQLVLGRTPRMDEVNFWLTVIAQHP
jgi:hypothetical protein